MSKVMTFDTFVDGMEAFKDNLEVQAIPSYTQAEYDALPAADKPGEGQPFIIVDD